MQRNLLTPGMMILAIASLVACDKLPDPYVEDFAADLADAVALDTHGIPDDAQDSDSTVHVPPVVVTDCMGTLEQGLAPGERVVVDLCDHIDTPPSAMQAAVRRIEDPADLLTGPAAQGQIGDYLIDTGVARFVVQGPDRHGTPCPFGATILDATYLGSDGASTPTPDNVGEICLFMQLGRTIRPEAEGFEVLADGSDGGAVILAATSTDALADWVSLSGLARQYLGVVLDIYFDPESPLDLTVTNYFVARPGENAMTYLTAVRNDGSETQHLLGGDLIDSGGVVEFFNPMSSLRGFGYAGIAPEQLNILAFAAKDSSHAYVPTIRGVDAEGAIEPDSSYIAISGVAAIVLGSTNPLGLLVSGRAARRAEGVAKLEPGEVHVWERAIYVGSEDLSTITDAVYAARNQPVGTLQGQVVDDSGAPAAGVRVAAIRLPEERTETRFVTDAEGRFGGNLRPGNYRIHPDPADRIATVVPEVEILPEQDATTAAEVGQASSLRVMVQDGRDGAPIPARVSVLCDGDCPRPIESQLRDVTFDGYGGRAAAVSYLGVDGVGDIELPPGNYQVVVSRGPTWTTYPPVAPGQGPAASAAPITIAPGQAATLDAELFPTIDTSGYVSADFHVHAINSPDAPVANADRVRSFLAAGVDVIISTDHDYITDYAPTVRDLGAEGVIASMIGVELTTFDYGHYNAFPLVNDPDDLVGGAVDWAVDEAPPLHPRDIFAAINAFVGDQVIQINHPSSGYLSLTGADVARQVSTMPPETFRMPPYEDPETGDTGLYVEGFTAVEVYNGYGRTTFWTCMNWWFAMLANGFKPTATASSDSHRLVTSMGGSPVTWVHVGEEHDSVMTFDAQVFARATNDNQAVGSSGPFVKYWATNDAGEQVHVGGTVASGATGAPVTLHVEIQTPIWMQVDTATLYGNVTDSSPAPGETNPNAPTPLDSISFALDENDLDSWTGAPDNTPPTRYRKEVSFQVSPDQDSFYIVTVESTSGPNMVPVIWSGALPFAFTNAIFVDVDGGGYDHPPGAIAPAGSGGGALASEPVRRAPTREDFEIIRAKVLEAHGH